MIEITAGKKTPFLVRGPNLLKRKVILSFTYYVIAYYDKLWNIQCERVLLYFVCSHLSPELLDFIVSLFPIKR